MAGNSGVNHLGIAFHETAPNFFAPLLAAIALLSCCTAVNGHSTPVLLKEGMCPHACAGVWLGGVCRMGALPFGCILASLLKQLSLAAAQTYRHEAIHDCTVLRLTHDVLVLDRKHLQIQRGSV